MKFLQSLENLWTPANAIAASIGLVLTPLLRYLYGPDRFDILTVMLLFIATDWGTGIAASKKDETYSSEYGLKRIPRTLFIIAFPAFANLLDRVMGTPGFLFYGVTFGLIYHTWNSMTANAHRAGWYVPKSVIDFVSSEIKAKADRSMKQKGEE
ncbi:phage holin family protein [Brevibacillus centrosporus]|uniref:phage holin family protein n=1 Tax=Brevibacillus centrosporus TaxID=54910 RepID=UPI003B02202B